MATSPDLYWLYLVLPRPTLISTASFWTLAFREDLTFRSPRPSIWALSRQSSPPITSAILLWQMLSYRSWRARRRSRRWSSKQSRLWIRREVLLTRMKHDLWACFSPNHSMCKLLRQQGSVTSLHFVFAWAVERIYSQGRRAVPTSCAKYAPQACQLLI